MYHKDWWTFSITILMFPEIITWKLCNDFIKCAGKDIWGRTLSKCYNFDINTTFYFVNKIFYNKYYWPNQIIWPSTEFPVTVCPSCVSLQLVFQDVLSQLHRVLAGAGRGEHSVAAVSVVVHHCQALHLLHLNPGLGPGVLYVNKWYINTRLH